MTPDVATLPPGERAFRLVVADGAGNVATRALAGRVPVAGADDPLARLRGARLVVAVPGARAKRRGARRVLVRRVRIGEAVAIAGRLSDAQGRAIAGAQVHARGHRGAVVGRAVTRADGRFRISARPAAGGPVAVGVPVGAALLPTRASADIRVEVRPRVTLVSSTASAAGGREVVFSGRLRPAPRQIGLGARKGVVLEWLDPVRRRWRPVLNARIARDGRFSIPWSFALSGLTIPMRVTVPTEVGWPLLPARSRVIRVAVR
jgi:hypothetical protein